MIHYLIRNIKNNEVQVFEIDLQSSVEHRNIDPESDSQHDTLPPYLTTSNVVEIDFGESIRLNTTKEDWTKYVCYRPDIGIPNDVFYYGYQEYIPSCNGAWKVERWTHDKQKIEFHLVIDGNIWHPEYANGRRISWEEFRQEVAHCERFSLLLCEDGENYSTLQVNHWKGR